MSVQCESLSADTAEPFIYKILQEKSLIEMFNGNETGLYWKLMSNKTLVSSKEGKRSKKFQRNSTDAIDVCNELG